MHILTEQAFNSFEYNTFFTSSLGFSVHIFAHYNLIELLVAQPMVTLFLQIILSEYDIDIDVCRVIKNINRVKILILSKI